MRASHWVSKKKKVLTWTCVLPSRGRFLHLHVLFRWCLWCVDSSRTPFLRRPACPFLRKDARGSVSVSLVRHFPRGLFFSKKKGVFSVALFFCVRFSARPLPLDPLPPAELPPAGLDRPLPLDRPPPDRPPLEPPPPNRPPFRLPHTSLF